MKKFVAILACCALCLGLVGCSEDPYANTTVLNVPYVSSGLGVSQHEEFKAYLEEKYKDHSFAEGKTGLHIELLSESVQVNIAKGDGYDVYGVGNMENLVEQVVGQDLVLKLDDIIEEKYDMVNGQLLSIKDKIEMHSPLIAAKSQLIIDGESKGYYSIPTTEFYPGVTFDVQSFVRNGLYLAEPEDDDAEEFESELIEKTFYFVDYNGKDDYNCHAQKSAGPDGVSGTEDDGLPATIEEFIALCEYCTNEKSIKAVNMSGKHTDYKNFIMEGLYTALLGPKQAATQYAFDNKEFEIITGFTKEPLFPGLTGSLANLKKPITQIVKLNENNAYYVTWSSAKYYAMAVAEILYREGFLFKNATEANADQRTVMYDLIFSGYAGRENKKDQVAMLAESSFWYREADVAGHFKEFYDNYPDDRIKRNFQFMALPVALDDSEASQAYLEKFNPNRTNTLVDHFSSAMYFSSTARDNPEKLAAIKVYIQESCSNDWLARKQEITGCKQAMYYTFDESRESSLPDYFQRLSKLTKKSEIVYYSSFSPVFTALNDYIMVGYNDQLFGWREDGFLHQLHLKTSTVNAVNFFTKEGKLLDKEGYKKLVSGIDESAAYHPYTFTK